MNFNEYQQEAIKTARYKKGCAYPLLALGEEVGELQGKFAKALRDGHPPDFLKSVVKEMGDVLWNLSCLAHDWGIQLEEVATRNLVKLADRERRGVIHGSGDER